MVNVALDKIANGYGYDGEEEDEGPVLERKAYSDPQLRDLDARGEFFNPRGDDGPRELTEDEYQEFLEDSECLVENGDVEPLAPDDTERAPESESQPDSGESTLRKLAPNMGDISPLSEYPPLGGFRGVTDPLADPDSLSIGSDIEEPREGSPEPDLCFPPHATHVREYSNPPSSEDEEDMMPADTADSVENVLDDSVEKEAVVQLRTKSKQQVILVVFCARIFHPLASCESQDKPNQVPSLFTDHGSLQIINMGNFNVLSLNKINFTVLRCTCDSKETSAATVLR